MKLIPKNWDNFQHYKHRSPPWIKLHKNLLDDMQYQRLPVASKALAPMLWLLASESNDGAITMSPEEIAFRLRMSEKDVISAIKPLIDNGFFIEDSNMLADSLQDATTEKSRVEKSRVREEKEIDTPDGVSSLVFEDFKKLRKSLKAPLTQTALTGIANEAKKANISLESALEMCCARGWRGFKAEWAKDQDVAKPNNDKQWMFSDQGIVAKANELGVISIGLTYPQLKEKCLLVMAKKAMA
jgi:hypothetical protein